MVADNTRPPPGQYVGHSVCVFRGVFAIVGHGVVSRKAVPLESGLMRSELLYSCKVVADWIVLI